MAEYISRTVADLLLQQRAEVYAKVGANYALTIIQGDRAVIHTIAKADVVEVVRCEDCKYYKPDCDGIMLCNYSELPIFDPPPKFFCAYGARGDNK